MPTFEFYLVTLVILIDKFLTKRTPLSVFWRVIMQIFHSYTHTCFAERAVEEILSPPCLTDPASLAVILAFRCIVIVQVANLAMVCAKSNLACVVRAELARRLYRQTAFALNQSHSLLIEFVGDFNALLHL